MKRLFIVPLVLMLVGMASAQGSWEGGVRYHQKPVIPIAGKLRLQQIGSSSYPMVELDLPNGIVPRNSMAGDALEGAPVVVLPTTRFILEEVQGVPNGLFSSGIGTLGMGSRIAGFLTATINGVQLLPNGNGKFSAVLNLSNVKVTPGASVTLSKLSQAQNGMATVTFSMPQQSLSLQDLLMMGLGTGTLAHTPVAVQPHRGSIQLF